MKFEKKSVNKNKPIETMQRIRASLATQRIHTGLTGRRARLGCLETPAVTSWKSDAFTVSMILLRINGRSKPRSIGTI